MNNKPIHPVQQIAEIIEQEGEKHEGTGFPWTLSAAKRILKEVDNWISVQIKLPDSNEPVLGWGKDWLRPGQVFYGDALHYGGDVAQTEDVDRVTWRWYNDGDALWGPPITHWQPLPNPPQQ